MSEPPSIPKETPPRVILYFDHTAERSGGELALLELVRALDRSRFIPVVVLGADGPLKEGLAAASIETHVLPLSSEVTATRKESLGMRSLLRLRAVLSLPGYILRLTRCLQARDADIVHANSLKADILAGFAGRMAGIPVIWHVRDRIEPDYLPAPAVSLFRRLCRLLPAAVIANSQATLQTLRLPAAKRALVAYSGLDLSVFTTETPSHREISTREDTDSAEKDGGGEVSDERVIGMIGRITQWKGQHVFLRAAAQVRLHFPAIRFQIVGAPLFGEAAYLTELHTLTRTLGLSDCVEFTGFRADVPALLRRMDILVHASTLPEPFGQTVVQGMAAGKPVVATNGGGIREIVLPGETGLLVPCGDADALADALCRLLSHPEEARQMGLAARRLVEQRFTIQQTVQAVQTLYETLPLRKSG